MSFGGRKTEDGIQSAAGEGGSKQEPGDSRAVKPIRPRVKQKSFLRHPQEHYVEELWTSGRLFEEREFGRVVVDPAAGFGNVVVSALSHGLEGYGSDLVKRAPFVAGGRDFLSPRWRPPAEVRGRSYAIVSNPPFGDRVDLVRGFAEAACARVERVALLTHVERINAAMPWLEALPLKEILYVLPRPSMWPGPLYAKKLARGDALGTGRRNVVWLIFERGFAGPATVGRLWRRRPDAKA